MHRLITIPFSHYVEKARWALDMAGIPYVEDAHMPLLSSAHVALQTGGRSGSADRVSSRFSVPCLLRDDGTVLHASADIARWASEVGGLGWYDDPEAAELEAHYHDRLGPQTRLAAYNVCFEEPRLLSNLAEINLTRGQTRRWRLIERPAFAVIRRALRVTEPRAIRAIDRTRIELDAVAARLADGRPFLLGDRLSAADVSFAAMLAPALSPRRAEGFGAEFPPRSTLPARGQALVQEVRDHPAGQFALKLYAHHRRPAPAQ